jgi:hypothetical protein
VRPTFAAAVVDRIDQGLEVRRATAQQPHGDESKV